MWSVRHNVALGAVLLTGCFLNHNGPGDPGHDAGARPDAAPTSDAGSPSACFASDGFVGRLACPEGEVAPGDFADVQLEHYPGGCCSTGRSVVDVERSGAAWTLTPRWTEVCDCCDLCDCLGPVSDGLVRIGPLVPGPNLVRAGGFECTIVAGLTPATCEEAPASARAARVLFPDQTDDVTLTHVATADCGCTARVEASGDDLSLSLCDCTDSCDDVITPYQAHAVGPARSIGEHPRSLGGAAAPLSVRAPDECYPLPALGLHVELPDPSARQVGPPLVWVGIDGEQGLCCADPLPAVRGEVAPDGVIDLTLYSCVQEDCFCLPDAPTPFTAWYSLGPVPPGDYVIVAGSERARFHVP